MQALFRAGTPSPGHCLLFRRVLVVLRQPAMVVEASNLPATIPPSPWFRPMETEPLPVTEFGSSSKDHAPNQICRSPHLPQPSCPAAPAPKRSPLPITGQTIPQDPKQSPTHRHPAHPSPRYQPVVLARSPMVQLAALLVVTWPMAQQRLLTFHCPLTQRQPQAQP
jgi:hypothetical protein